MRTAAFGLLAGMAFSIAFAQEDAVVVTATRLPQVRSLTLQPVNVITAEDIAKGGQQTLVEVLQTLGGVEVTNTGGFGQPSGVFIRGANTSHTLVLIDGMRVNSATTGTTAVENIPLSQIERIEVVPGQLSSLYGSDAIGGVIQIFTRAGADAPRTELTGGVGSYSTRTVAAGLNRAVGDTQLNFGFGYFETAGFDATKSTIPFGQHNPDRDGYRNHNMSARVAHRLSNEDELGINVFYGEANTHFDNGPTTDDVNHQTLSTYSIYSRNQIGKRWQSLVRLGESTDDLMVTGAFPGFFTTRQPQFTWQNNVTFGPGTAIVGVDYLEQRVISDTAYTQTHRTNKAVFAGYVGSTERHGYQVNVRHDDNSQFGDHTTGSVGYGYNVTRDLRLRVGGGSGFKAPTFNDLYFPGFSNPNLRPERSRSKEAGVNYQLDGHRFSATYFDNQITDLIVFDNVTLTPQNVERARITGTELGYRATFVGLQARAQATFQNPHNEETGKMLPRRAKQFGSLALGNTVGPLRLGAELVASGYRFDAADETPGSKMHGYALLNLTATYVLSRELSVRARWNNVFDREYELAQNFNTPGSNVFVGLQYQLQ